MKPTRKQVVITVACLLASGVQAQPAFTPRGIGGGGALFAPSISHAIPSEYYVACDMSGLYHTADFGHTYTLSGFSSLQAGPASRMQFTNIANIRYCIDYTNDLGRPVKSMSGGASWSTLPGNPYPNESCYGLYADYHNADRLVLSFEDEIYFSPDGGQTTSLVHAANGTSVAVGGVHFNGNTIYIGSSDGLLVSADGGATFSLSPATGIPPGEAILSFAAATQGNTTRLLALTADANDVYPGRAPSAYWGVMKGVYTLDAGNTAWLPRMTGLDPAKDFMLHAAMAANDIDQAYLAGGTDSGVPAVFRTLDGGQTWTPVLLTPGNQNIATGWCGDGGDRSWGYAECVFGLAVAPANANRVVLTDYGFVHTSDDGGLSWQQAYVEAADQNAPAATTPVFKPYHTAGLENTSCWSMLWIDATHLLAGFSDIRGLKSDDGGQAWKMAGNTTLNTTYHYVRNPSTGILYAATSGVHDLYQTTHLTDAAIDAADGEIMYSLNNGTTWTLLHDFNHPVTWMAIDPNNPSRMYAAVVHYAGGVGEGGIWTTGNLNQGPNSVWSKLPVPPRTEGHPLKIIALKNWGLLCSYSGRRDASGAFTPSSGVFYMPPGTGTWTDVSDPGMLYYTKDVVVDPHDGAQDTWYACVWDGWGGPPNALGGLYRTTDKGQNWTRIFNASGRVSSITLSPVNPAEAWLTTERDGLWHSTDIQSPAPVFTQVAAYPFRQPERVYYDPYDASALWVTSFGAGLWTASLSPSAVPVQAARPIQYKIYPNPVRSRLSVCHFSGRVRKVEVYSLAGELLLRCPANGRGLPVSSSGCADLDVSAVRRGTALVKVFLEGSQHVVSEPVVFQ